MNNIGQFNTKMGLLGPGGTLSPEASTYFSRQNQYIQKNLSPSGYVHPNLSQSSINNLANVLPGTTLFNTALNKLQVYNGIAWETVTSS